MESIRERRRRQTSRAVDCAWSQSEIERLGDRRPGRLVRLRLQRHAEGCAECAARLARMDAVLDALSSMDRVVAPEGFTELVLARLAAARSLPIGPRGETGAGEDESRRGFWWVAVAGVGVALGVAVWRHLAGQHEDERLAPVV